MSTTAQIATLAHGFTMAEIDKMAWKVTQIHPSRMVSFDEVAAIAWHGIVVALYEAETPPKRYDLVAAGLSAVHHEHQRMTQMYGISSRGGAAPNFVRYWSDRNGGGDFTDRIAERLALPAVLGELTPMGYEAISTLAAFDGDMHAAAAAIGVGYTTFESRIVRARRQLEALWFEHETPRSRAPGGKDKCVNGHSRAEHGHRDKRGSWVCRPCHKSAKRRFLARERDNRDGVVSELTENS